MKSFIPSARRRAEKIRSQDSKLEALRAEKESLKQVLEDQMKTSVKDKKRKEEADAVYNLILKYFGVGSKLLQSVLLSGAEKPLRFHFFRTSRAASGTFGKAF